MVCTVAVGPTSGSANAAVFRPIKRLDAAFVDNCPFGILFLLRLQFWNQSCPTRYTALLGIVCPATTSADSAGRLMVELPRC